MTCDVAIYVLDREAFYKTDYFIKWLMREWNRTGLRVEVVGASERLPEARLVVAHLDVTIVNEPLTRPLSGHPLVVNGTHADISKRRISAGVVRPGDGYDGPVIVKTDLNFGGWPELHAHCGGGSLLARARSRLRRSLPWYVTGLVQPGAYRIYDRASLVPWPIRRNPDFVVERFVPETADGHYCLRHHFFFGDLECDYLLMSTSPVIKTNNVARFRPIGPAPQELRELRRRLGLDYGRLDYVMDGDRPVLFDANRTPAFSLAVIPFPYEQVARRLAPAVQDYLEGTQRPLARCAPAVPVGIGATPPMVPPVAKPAPGATA